MMAISVKASSSVKELSSEPQKSGRSASPATHRATASMMAAASRRARKARSPVAPTPRASDPAPRVCTPTMAASPRSGAGGAGLPVSRAQIRAAPPPLIAQGSISTAPSRIRPRKAGTAPGGSCAVPCTSILMPATSTMRTVGTPSRSTLSISTTSAAPMQAPITRPRPPAIEAPPTITAAMTISSAPWPYWEVMPLSWATFISPASVAASAENR